MSTQLPGSSRACSRCADLAGTLGGGCTMTAEGANLSGAVPATCMQGHMLLLCCAGRVAGNSNDAPHQGSGAAAYAKVRCMCAS
jgi:hypothetical protein